MTQNQLKRYNGRNGMKAYVGYKGKVYDVTESPFWKEGDHEGLHSAGADLTPMMIGAPHGDEVFNTFRVVAMLEEEKTEEQDEPSSIDPLKERLQQWYRKYHPHPMTVHFPIALHIFAAGLDLLFLTYPKTAYAVGVFYTFFVATVMGFVAMIPGLLSWWVNYDLSTRRPFIVKLIVATLTLLLGVVGITLYLEDPAIVYEASVEGIIYHAIVLFTGMTVVILGYYGGKITWGDSPEAEKKTATAVTETPLPDTSGELPGAGRFEVPFASEQALLPIQRLQHEAKTTDFSKQSGVAILIGGAAGSGIDTLEKILSDAFRRSGYYLFSTKEYMSRVRGGSNTVLIRISDAPVEAPCRDVDLFIAIDAPALEHARWRCSEKTVIVADGISDEKEKAVTALPMKAEAQKLGSVHYANTYAAGAVFGLFGIDLQPLVESVAEHFKGDTKNEAALRSGQKAGAALDRSGLPALPETHPGETAKLHLMDGTTASGFGFLIGGCNFVASYPMSPSTGVLNFMASMSKQFPVAVEQSEDEIASLHMVMGAWYAGARALTTTSGGGFALMGEALSLAGMSETPAVIYLAQRPGPATGLPTRSEQGDLNMALHSGHGPFPRLILAPGSLRECIELGYLAFELADRYQLPVIVLSDQYLADSMTMVSDVDFSRFEQRRYIVPTDDAYQRYAETESGVSPRGVPAFGDGLVCADGHEHDVRGQITEDPSLRVKMVSKRARKEADLIAEASAPERYGEGRIAVIGWGSTRGVIAEALRRVDDPRLMQVHFSWVHPLNPEHLEFLQECTHRIVIENNADGAFADRLQHYGISVDSSVLQFNGFAFFADELAATISKRVKELS
ncbi:2-oxoacid:acceptor oxidoreductase subunit alpha [Sulfurimonas sp. HSL3-7]|uniref:2-oxoacid:acceptor oxidoreductase subunit alpha n=1 Tax=Sulfonitrofixus jiaomeiensis TaxID=3131938 RepID=UPI0031F7460F